MREFFINQVFDGNLLIAIVVSMIAGLISFFSPCVIPLVPGYLSYASGMSVNKSRRRVLLGSARSINQPNKINGAPNPTQYAAERMAPRCAVALWKARTWTAPSVGPIQGVQPIPKAKPRSGAVTKPVLVLKVGLKDRAEPFRKFITKRGDLITKIGGTLLIIIGIMQVSDTWDYLMNTLRDLISGFIPVI